MTTLLERFEVREKLVHLAIAATGLRTLHEGHPQYVWEARPMTERERG
jgi:hypothetical protein